MRTKLLSAQNRLTAPWVEIDDDDRRYDAQALASLSVVVALLSLFSALLILPIIWNQRLNEVLIVVVSALLFIIPYIFSRYGQLRATVLAGAGVATMMTLLVSGLLSGHAGLHILYYLINVVIFSASFVSIRSAFVIMMAYCALMLLGGPFVLNVPLPDIIEGPLAFNLIAGIYSLIFIYHWKRKETHKQQALQASQSRYRMISDLTSDYTFYHRLNSSGRFVREWITDAFEDITGYTFDELPAEDVLSIVHPDDVPKAQEALRAVISGQHVESEYRIFRKDGELRWLSIKRVPNWNAAHTRVIGHYGAVVDITARKREEEQRWQLALQHERFALLNQFVQAVSHDFRTRLSRVESARYVIGKILEDGGDGERINQSLAAIRDSVFQMNTQIANLSLITAVNDPKPTPIDIRPLLIRLNEHYMPRATTRKLTFRVQVDDDLPFVKADEAKLQVAFTHLIENALAHTAEGGRIILRAEAERRHLVVEVSDTGEGIAADQVMRIFEPFYKVDGARTPSRAGLGLGLTIAKMVIDAHEGTIEVESMPGKGSTFRVRLPLAFADAPTPLGTARV